MFTDTYDQLGRYFGIRYDETHPEIFRHIQDGNMTAFQQYLAQSQDVYITTQVQLEDHCFIEHNLLNAATLMGHFEMVWRLMKHHECPLDDYLNTKNLELAATNNHRLIFKFLLEERIQRSGPMYDLPKQVLRSYCAALERNSNDILMHLNSVDDPQVVSALNPSDVRGLKLALDTAIEFGGLPGLKSFTESEPGVLSDLFMDNAEQSLLAFAALNYQEDVFNYLVSLKKKNGQPLFEIKANGCQTLLLLAERGVLPPMRLWAERTHVDGTPVCDPKEYWDLAVEKAARNNHVNVLKYFFSYSFAPKQPIQSYQEKHKVIMKCLKLAAFYSQSDSVMYLLNQVDPRVIPYLARERPEVATIINESQSYASDMTGLFFSLMNHEEPPATAKEIHKGWGIPGSQWKDIGPKILQQSGIVLDHDIVKVTNTLDKPRVKPSHPAS